jgi:hypothetical protein
MTTRKALALCATWLALTGTAAAQSLPSEPISLGGGRLVLGGDAAVSVSPDDPGYFNYADYEHNTLREVRFGLTASMRASSRLAILGELRSENFDHVSPFALYARVRPFPTRRFDIQAGRIPPTFGAFTRRAYGNDNPLIGYPLAYQYLTSLRADAVPSSADDLLRMRGRGWQTTFGVGNPEASRGLPLVTAFSWDTGVQVSTGWRAVAVAGAVTNGSASNPRVSDDNAGKQIALRAALTPATGLVIGSSFSRGAFLGRRVLNEMTAGSGRQFVQRVHGVDAEYSRDHWVVRADAVRSQWQLPEFSSPSTQGRLKALAGSVEARYTFMPGAYAAARVERLTFNRIAGTTRIATWDAPVSRYEIGGGYYLQRNVVARLSYQHNTRDGGRVTRDGLMAAQLLFWF